MRTRRGTTSYWPGALAGHIASFQRGDIVTSTLVAGDFIGVVRDVQPKINKVMVAWGGGSLVQHDPEEIQLSLRQTEVVKQRMASRRTKVAMEPEDAEANPQFVGDPETHGIDKPRGGGFSIMQNLAKSLAKESEKLSDGNPLVSEIQSTDNMKSRRAMYWCGPERTYRLTRKELVSGTNNCPKCCAEMGSQPYTKQAKLLVCEDCGFKISSDKVLKEKPVEVVPVEPQVTVASLKSRRTSAN